MSDDAKVKADAKIKAIAAQALAGDRNVALQLISGASMSLRNNHELPRAAHEYLIEAFGRILAGQDASIALGLKPGKPGAPPGSPDLIAWRDWSVCARVIEYLNAHGRPAEVPDLAFKEIAKNYGFTDIHDGRRQKYYGWKQIKKIWNERNPVK